MDFDAGWAANAQQIQQKLSESWTQALAAFRQAGGGAAANGDPAQALPAIRFSPDKLAELQQQYLKEASELWSQAMRPAELKDRRFSATAWSENPMAAFSAAAYLLNARTLMGPVSYTHLTLPTKRIV